MEGSFNVSMGSGAIDDSSKFDDDGRPKRTGLYIYIHNFIFIFLQIFFFFITNLYSWNF